MSLDLKKVEGGSVFRKIAMGSWRSAGDPSVYGLLEIDVSKALKHIERLEAQAVALAGSGAARSGSEDGAGVGSGAGTSSSAGSGLGAGGSAVKISMSHLVGKAVARVLSERPEINGMIRLSRIYQRKHVDLFYQINIPGNPSDPVSKATLSGEVIRRAETLSVVEIAQQLAERAAHIRVGGQGDLNKSMARLKLVPWKLIYLVLNLTSFINYDLGISLRWLGMPRDAFGSVMITNIGSLGADLAWAPLVPYSKVPLLLTIGAVRERPWVVDGQVVVRPIMKIGVTFDHRFMDGVHAAAMSRIFQECFEEPEKYLV